jgi:ribonuclease HI
LRIDRNHRNRNVHILSDNQAEIEALGNQWITSKVVWDCHQSLMQLAKHNRCQLAWVLGHEAIAGGEAGNEEAKL